VFMDYTILWKQDLARVKLQTLSTQKPTLPPQVPTMQFPLFVSQTCSYQQFAQRLVVLTF